MNKSSLVGLDILQKDVLDLFHFLHYPFAVSADNEGVFLRAGVLPEDQGFLRFQWREETTADAVVHQYTRFIFGARDLPTCAIYALQRTARDSQATFSDAASADLDKFYTDDYPDSFEDPEVAFKLSEELITLLAIDGLKLTKIISNVTKIIKELNSSKSAPRKGSKILQIVEISPHLILV